MNSLSDYYTKEDSLSQTIPDSSQLSAYNDYHDDRCDSYIDYKGYACIQSGISSARK